MINPGFFPNDLVILKIFDERYHYHMILRSHRRGNTIAKFTDPSNLFEQHQVLPHEHLDVNWVLYNYAFTGIADRLYIVVQRPTSKEYRLCLPNGWAMQYSANRPRV